MNYTSEKKIASIIFFFDAIFLSKKQIDLNNIKSQLNDDNGKGQIHLMIQQL
jgi:hypothetical protein